MSMQFGCITMKIMCIVVILSALSGDSLIQRKESISPPSIQKKPGKVVDIKNTTPYTSMQLNLNPLEHALYSKN